MKLKSLLKESKAWERKFGEPLPTLEDTSKAYRLKQENLNEDKDLLKVATRRYHLMVVAAIGGSPKALRGLDNLLGFL